MTADPRWTAMVEAAARQIARQLLLAEMTIEDRCDADVEGAYDAMIETMRPLIHALDALPASPAPAPERTVEVALWENKDGDLRWARIGSPADNWAAWKRLGTTTVTLAGEGA